MKITGLNSGFNSQTFKANLYYNNEQLNEYGFNYGNIADCGAKNTDIFVSGINVKQIGRDNYASINFTLSSPIFGYRTFKNTNRHNFGGRNPNDNIMDAEEFVHRSFASPGNTIEYFENKTLEQTLLKTINKNARANKISFSTDYETDAVKILDEILSGIDKEKEGLNEERIKELNNVAKEINKKVILEGSNSLLDKMA